MKVNIDKDIKVINKFILKTIHKQIKKESIDYDINENHIVNFKLGQPINKLLLKKYKDDLPIIKKS